MSVAHPIVKPPRLPAIFQSLAVLGAATLAWLVSVDAAPWQFALVGYVLGAIVAVFLLTLHRSLSSMRRSKNFRPNPLLDRLVLFLAGAGLLVGLYCGYLLATELAKW